MSRQMHGLTKAVEANKRRFAEAETAEACGIPNCSTPATKVWTSWDGRCTPLCDAHFEGAKEYWRRKREGQCGET